MMLLLITCCLLVPFTAVKGDCDESRRNLPAANLKRDLLCNYDGKLRPVTDHTTNITVIIRFLVKYFEYDQDMNTITVDSWLILQWKDQHLKWNPADYSGIKSVHLASDKIWVPDLSIFNTRDHSEGTNLMGLITCLVYSSGMVVCVPAVRIEALCVSDLAKYPFDTQNCTLRIGSWVHTGEQINLAIPTNNSVMTDGMTPNGEWELDSAKAVKFVAKHKNSPNSTYPSIHISFVMNRLHRSHAAVVIIPAIVIIIITLTSLWLSPLISERMTLCCVNLICTYLYSEYLSWRLPLKGVNTPYILLFARDSLLLCAFTILFTVILKNLVTTKSPAPGWISSTVDFVLGCRPGQWLFLDDSSLKGVATAKNEEDGERIVENGESSTSSPSKAPSVEDYIVFAKMLDRTLFIIYCVLFFGMFIAYTP